MVGACRYVEPDTTGVSNYEIFKTFPHILDVSVIGRNLPLVDEEF